MAKLRVTKSRNCTKYEIIKIYIYLLYCELVFYVELQVTNARNFTKCDINKRSHINVTYIHFCCELFFVGEHKILRSTKLSICNAYKCHMYSLLLQIDFLRWVTNHEITKFFEVRNYQDATHTNIKYIHFLVLNLLQIYFLCWVTVTKLRNFTKYQLPRYSI